MKKSDGPKAEAAVAEVSKAEGTGAGSGPGVSPSGGLPVLTSVGWYRTDKGWVVYLVRHRGDEILDRELIEGPCSMAIAEQALTLAFMRHVRAAGLAQGVGAAVQKS